MTDRKLNQIEERIWNDLNFAVDNATESFNSFVLGTMTAHGPSLRTTILRSVDSVRRRIYFCADARSAKIEEIEKADAVCALFFDPSKKYQIRMYGRATVLAEDEVARSIWAKLAIPSRILMSSKIAPGTRLEKAGSISDKLLGALSSGVHSGEPSVTFAAIEIAASKIDYLDIRVGRHKRAVISNSDPSLSHWIQP